MSTFTASHAAELFRKPPDRFIDVDDAAVAYRQVGSGPDVLFVHGWPVSGATFRTLLPHFVEYVTCHIIDFPGAGSSRFDDTTPLSLEQHVRTVRRVVDEVGLDDVAVVGHDSGGLITRHAFAGDPRVRAMGLINTEQSGGAGWRFRSLFAAVRLPGVGKALGWAAGHKRVRRNGFLLGDAFADAAFLEGEFDEFFLQPLHEQSERIDAAVRFARSFDMQFLRDLPEVHQRISCPVELVWGDQDPFFPVAGAREMIKTFPDAHLTVIEGAGLFAHEERPTEVAAALLPLVVEPRAARPEGSLSGP